ncbi:MAG: hypothetical protein HY663_06575, partial [Chloroflexi bacterium]|nr:hypothetical protein [Chloroflexota bacterium]
MKSMKKAGKNVNHLQKDEGIILGITTVPHFRGNMDSVGYSAGMAGNAYGYPFPKGYEKAETIVAEDPDFEPRAKVEREYRYPRLVEGEAFFMEHWRDSDFQAVLDQELKFMKWLGADVVRIHLLGPEHEDFLDWYLPRVTAYGFQIYMDAFRWGTLPGWVERYGRWVSRWQTNNEWIVGFPKIIDKNCLRHREVYEAAKAKRRDAQIGINAWTLGRDGNRDFMKKLKVHGAKIDFFGFDYYSGDDRDVAEFIRDVNQFARDNPGLELLLTEYGFHALPPCELEQYQWSCRSNFSDFLMEEEAAKVERDMEKIISGTPIREVYWTFLNDYTTLRFSCYHFVRTLQGEPTPLAHAVRRVFQRRGRSANSIVDSVIPDLIIQSGKESVIVSLINLSGNSLRGTVTLEPPGLFDGCIRKPMRAVKLDAHQTRSFSFNLETGKDIPVGIYIFFARIELESKGRHLQTYGLGTVRKVSPTLPIDERLTEQIPEGVTVRYAEFEKLKAYRFLGDGDIPPMIVYGKDAYRGGPQM